MVRISRVLFLLCLCLASCTPKRSGSVSTHPAAQGVSPTITSAPGSTAVNSPETSELPEALPPAALETLPSSTPDPTPHSVLLISWDGGRADLVYGLMEDGTLPHFAALAGQGVRAEYAQTVDPSLTAPAQNSIATGCYPAHTGIVSNAFHNSNDSFYWYRSGFDEPLDQAEPVWVSASRAGLTSAALFFNGATPLFPGQMADYTISYGVQDAYSRQETISLLPAQSWDNPPLSYSPALEGSFYVPEVARVYLLVLDSSDDGSANYDQVLLNTSPQVEDLTPRLGVGAWAPLVLRASTTSGADFLIQEINPKQVTLFHTTVYHNLASPRAFHEALNQEFGFFRSGPDIYALEHGWITQEDNLHLLENASRWMAEVTAWVYKHYHPDLIYTWQDGFDTAGHNFLLADPRQPGYSSELEEQSAESYRRAARIADQALEIMLEPVDLGSTTILLVADHGMAPVHTRVYVNTVLEQARLLALDKKDYVVVNRSKAFAVASGGAVNVYVNLEGRETSGIVSAVDYAQVQNQIVDLLSALSDPDTGQPIFSRLLRRGDLAAIGLDHPGVGDVFAQASPGYELDGWRGKDFIFEPSTNIYGQHGYNSALPEMYAMFIAAGTGVPANGAVIPPVHVVDYAPTIASLLDFPLVPIVDGSPIRWFTSQ